MRSCHAYHPRIVDSCNERRFLPRSGYFLSCWSIFLWDGYINKLVSNIFPLYLFFMPSIGLDAWIHTSLRNHEHLKLWPKIRSMEIWISTFIWNFALMEPWRNSLFLNRIWIQNNIENPRLFRYKNFQRLWNYRISPYEFDIWCLLLCTNLFSPWISWIPQILWVLLLLSNIPSLKMIVSPRSLGFWPSVIYCWKHLEEDYRTTNIAREFKKITYT